MKTTGLVLACSISALVGLAAEPAADPSSISWVARIKADKLPTGPVTSIRPSGRGTGLFTGSATIVAGENGINGHKAISFNGTSNFFSSTTGGLAMQATFYLGTVVKHSNLGEYQNYISFGDAEKGRRRSMLLTKPYKRLAFVGAGADIRKDGPAFSNNTTYFMEMVRTANNETKLYVNGRETNADRILTLRDFSSDTVVIGASPSRDEFFSGLMAELFVKTTPPTAAEWHVIRSYVASAYDIPVAGSAPVPGSPAMASITSKDGNIILGEGDPALTGGTLVKRASPAKVTVPGTLAVNAGGGVSVIASDVSGENVFQVWNKNIGGYSANTYCHHNGAEAAAIGWGAGSEPWGANTPEGSFYIETYNPPEITGTAFIPYRLIQTRTNPYAKCLRHEMQANGDFVWFSQTNWADAGVQPANTQMTLENSTGNLVLNNSLVLAGKTGATGKEKANSTTINAAPPSSDRTVTLPDASGSVVVSGPGMTPAREGELQVEVTNDSTLTFKLKGSDGIVRSATITLAP